MAGTAGVPLDRRRGHRRGTPAGLTGGAVAHLSCVDLATSRNVNGMLGGKINDGDISALVEANGFAASLNMKTAGNKQTIAIRSQNTDLRGVDITLTR